MNYGFIYLLANPCMPGIYKIGMTDRSPTQRCEELSSNTSCPRPFEILFYMEVDQALRVERALHSYFGDSRVNQSREFFRVDPVEVYDYAVSEMTTEYVSPDMLFLMSKATPKLALVEV